MRRSVHSPPSLVHRKATDDGLWMVGEYLLVVLLCGTILFATVVHPNTVEGSEVRAGVARDVFILPEGVPLAGYSRRRGTQSHSLHDPVGVRALVLQDADTAAALVSCDVLIITERLFDAVHRRVIAGGLPERTVLMIAATHTHSGPGAYGESFLEQWGMGRYDPKVFDAVASTIAQTILRAHEQLVPVQIAYERTATEGLVVNRTSPEGVVDADVTVCAFVREGRVPLAVLVNFAAHPTTLGSWNTQLSADYPGVVMRDVERRFPTATCLFFAGAVGDQGPVKEGNDYAPAERVGQKLTAHVIALIEKASEHQPAHLAAAQERIPLPPARVRVHRAALPSWLSRALVDDDATLSALVIGDIAFFGVPCDLFASLGHILKHEAESRSLQPMVVGFANDYIGYCVPEAAYNTDTYEASMAFNGPTTGSLIVDRLIQLLDQLQ